MDRTVRLLILLARIERLQRHATGPRYEELEAKWNRCAFLLGKSRARDQIREHRKETHDK